MRPRLSVVLPAFDEADRVGASVSRVRSELSNLGGGGLEIVVVDDGSSDATAQRAREAGADRVVVQPENRGKGAAVRAGVAVAKGRTVAFTDVDLSYAPSQIVNLLEAVEAGAAMVVGSRWHAGSSASARASTFRMAASRLFNLATRLTVGLWRDTQCGLKAFDSEVAPQLFSRATLDGFSFDVELFLAARAAGIDVVEVPVRLDGAEGSTVGLRSQITAVSDLWALRRRLRRGAYQPARSAAPED